MFLYLPIGKTKKMHWNVFGLYSYLHHSVVCVLCSLCIMRPRNVCTGSGTFSCSIGKVSATLGCMVDLAWRDLGWG